MWYEIFKFEIKYRIKRPDTYIFFIALFLFSIVAFDFLNQGGRGLGLVKENSPFVIARTMAIVSGLFMIITSIIMGVPILRDFEYNMESLLFSNPIKKRDYLLGRFLGSFLVLIFVFSGLLFGMILGDFMPWRDADNLLPFNFWVYLKPFLTIVMPTLFFGGGIFFVSGALSRNLIVVFTQGIFFFVAFILSTNIPNPTLSAIFDPFSTIALGDVTQSWSVVELNALSIPIEGLLFYNRLFWMLLGILALIIGYYAFNYNVVKAKVFKKKLKKQPQESSRAHKEIEIPNATLQEGFKASWAQLKSHSLFHFKSIFKQPSFWSLVIIGMVVIFINSISIGALHGVNSYPATYLIVEELKESSFFFFLIILVFYSGELIWKERKAKLNLIYDALPVSDFINLSGKFIALSLTYIVLFLALILSGIIFQTLHGYYNYELDVYFIGFFLGLFPFLILYTFISFFFQVVFNSKFVGYILVLLFFMLTMGLSMLGYGHALYTFGSGGLIVYSDMNGYGHFLEGYGWFQLYWLAFSIFLFAFTVIFVVRGNETAFKIRRKISIQRLTKPIKRLGVIALVIFMLIGSYIFYNTNVLNKYSSNLQQYDFRANYEKALKKFERLAAPKIVAVNLEIELYPEDRNYTVEGYYLLTNTQLEPINKIDIQKWFDSDIALKDINFEGGATLDSIYMPYHYYRYTLKNALKKGDSIKMKFTQTFTSKGFVEGVPNIEIVGNGTLLGSDHFPQLGYSDRFELRDDKDREEYGLPLRINLAQQEDASIRKAGSEDHDIMFETVIGTDSSQIAIAPGSLQKKWRKGSRSYFHYKVNKPMMNLYSIVSARYEVLKDTWISSTDSIVKPVDLGIYYHKGHEYNLDRMMESLKMSLDYFSTHFSPYQYQQLRIAEFPRYNEFAQSFPNMIPFSEAIGFIMNIDDEKDVDMAFFHTAHEVAHQWWGHQIMVEEVGGWAMIIETLAQYSAIMVLKEKYPEDKIQQFLKIEMDSYLRGRVAEAKQELPLALVENQKYIFYRKGAVNMYAFQDYIGEDNVNLALKRFTTDWNRYDGIHKDERFTITKDLLGYFKEVTPDSLQYVVKDLFETVTLYDNNIMNTNSTLLDNGSYQVDIEFQVSKYRIDETGNRKYSDSEDKSEQSNLSLPLADYIEIGIFGEEKELLYLKKHKITTVDNKITIIVNHMPTEVGVDPYSKLIDTNMQDNIKTLLEK